MSSRRKFRRPSETRRYRKVFVIATEGAQTESQYFYFFRNEHSTIKITCLCDKTASSPRDVLKRIRRRLLENDLKATDEVWVVVDRDTWPEEQLDTLLQWSRQTENYSMALSNPCFEYWLLLHFESATRLRSAHRCRERLRRYLPEYDKSIKSGDFPIDQIEAAIQRAEERDTPPCQDWPRNPGVTTVYRLVRRLRLPSDDQQN